MKTICLLLVCSWCLHAVANTDTVPLKEISRFWQDVRARLDRIPPDATIEPVKAALPYRQYKVTVMSLDNVTITGLLSIPVQGEAPAKPWPVIISNPGYGGWQQGVMLSECQRGYAILQVFPRGQGESEAALDLKGRDKLTLKTDAPQGAYYEGAYADVMRMIDFVATRSDLDSGRVALVSTSQGGGISLAVAALDKRVKAVAVHVPFLCHFRMAANIPRSLVKTLLDKATCNNETTFNTLDYFDPYQLAPLLKVPVLMSAGGKDETCPLVTIRSVYDRLTGERSLKEYPDLVHTSCVDFYNTQWPWLDNHLKMLQ